MTRALAAECAKVSGLTEQERAVCDEIARDEQGLFDLLSVLVRFRTPNPPGGNEVPAQRFVEQRLRAAGLEVDSWDVLPGRPNVVGVWRGGDAGPKIALNGHIDVCEDQRLEAWSSDPYEPVIDGRDMIGRGASDMKSGLASFVFAVETLRRANMVLDGEVIVQSVTGEESGQPGTRSAIERGYGGDVALVGEPTRGVGLVAGVGIVSGRITVESDSTLHMIARRNMTVAGGQLAGANCVEKLTQRIIPALLDLEREWAVFKTHPLIPPGNCLINVFRIEGGSNAFIMPNRCSADVSVTYLPDETREAVIAEVEERVRAAAMTDGWLRDHPPSIEWATPHAPIEFAPSSFDPDSREARVLQAAIRALGREPQVGGRASITDAGWFARAGIPVIVYGPGDVAFAHAPDERVHLDELVAHCQAVAVFLMRICGRS